MSSVMVCDVCGKPVEKPHFKLRILKSQPDEESRDWKTVGNLDMHETCLKLFKEWLVETKKKELAK
jgi:hypothetical protein